MRLWVLIIIIVGISGLFLGYVLSFPCENFPRWIIIKYLYNLKCKEAPPPPSFGIIPPINIGNQTNNQPPSTPGVVPPSGLKNSKASVLYEDEINDYYIKENGEIIIVDKKSKIIKVVGDKQEIINEANKELAKEIVFSADGSKIIFGFDSGISVFDLNTQKWRQIEGGYGFSVSPNNELAYFKKDGNFNSIFKLDLKKEDSSPIKLIQTNVLDSYLLWKDNKDIFIVSKPSSVAVGTLLLFDSKNKELDLIYELLGLDFGWDPKTQQGLLFSAEGAGRGGRLFILNKNLTPTELSFLTMPSKCAFKENGGATTTQKFLICAVPKNQEALKDKFIIDDWLTNNLYTEDDFYQINLEGGLIEGLDIKSTFDVERIKIFKNNLFFINRFDKKLYSFKLPQ